MIPFGRPALLGDFNSVSFSLHRRIQTEQSATNGFTWAFFKVDRSRVSETSASDGPNRRTAKLARVEAVLFVADGAVSHRRLAQLATLADAAEAQRLVERLNELYDASASAFRVERVATGYQLMTRSEFSFWLDKLHHRQSSLKLSAPAIETLAMVAYRQPITRADVEAIRGVQSTEMLKQLMERGLVRIAGHEESLGRPYLYATTAKFLELHGLRMLDDLPMSDQLRLAKVDKETSGNDEATKTEQVDDEELNDEELNDEELNDEELDDEELDGEELDGEELDGEELDGEELDGEELDGEELDEAQSSHAA